jgi:hypothetical protein
MCLEERGKLRGENPGFLALFLSGCNTPQINPLMLCIARTVPDNVGRVKQEFHPSRSGISKLKGKAVTI